MNAQQILSLVSSLVATWQAALGSSVRVVLGGSLVSGLLVFDEETKVIDVDLRFLVDDPEDEAVRREIEAITGLVYRKTVTVGDWPSGESIGVMVEGIIKLPELPLPLDVEGCIRNPKYVGWARFYRTVLTEQELEEFRQRKVTLRHDKVAYKKMKGEMISEVQRRCIAAGLV